MNQAAKDRDITDERKMTRDEIIELMARAAHDRNWGHERDWDGLAQVQRMPYCDQAADVLATLEAKGLVIVEKVKPDEEHVEEIARAMITENE